jgi:hypothetical protein
VTSSMPMTIDHSAKHIRVGYSIRLTQKKARVRGPVETPRRDGLQLLPKATLAVLRQLALASPAMASHFSTATL